MSEQKGTKCKSGRLFHREPIRQFPKPLRRVVLQIHLRLILLVSAARNPKHRLIFARRPGQNDKQFPRCIEKHSDRRTVGIRQYFGPINNICLPFIDLWHLAAPEPKTFAKIFNDLVMKHQFAARCLAETCRVISSSVGPSRRS